MALWHYWCDNNSVRSTVCFRFYKYFRIFHKIFFANDLWMFDPATDYMIRMLPEGFFLDFVFRIGGFFVGSLAVLGVVSAVVHSTRNVKRKISD